MKCVYWVPQSRDAFGTATVISEHRFHAVAIATPSHLAYGSARTEFIFRSVKAAQREADDFDTTPFRSTTGHEGATQLTRGVPLLDVTRDGLPLLT